MPDNTSIEVASGGLIEDSSGDELKIAIVKRHQYDDWALPKGHLDPGESLEQAALREVEEETGSKGEIIEIVDPVAYLVKGHPKIVVFYRMKLAERRPFNPDDEIADVRWVTPETAVSELTYPTERELVARVYGL